MIVRYTDAALADLQDISDWLSAHYPTIAPVVSSRIQTVVAHIARWPRSARRVPERPDVRALPLGRYPYVIFYSNVGNEIHILHIHHAARRNEFQSG